MELTLEVSSATFNIKYWFFGGGFVLLFSIVLNLSGEMIRQRSYSRQGVSMYNSVGLEKMYQEVQVAGHSYTYGQRCS